MAFLYPTVKKETRSVKTTTRERILSTAEWMALTAMMSMTPHRGVPKDHQNQSKNRVQTLIRDPVKQALEASENFTDP